MNTLLLCLYQFLFPLIAVGVLLKLWADGRGRTLNENTADLKERLGLAAPAAAWGRGSARPLWLHAASLGEVNALAPLIERLSLLPTKPPLLLTCSTAAGRLRARALPGVDAALLAPADFYPAVRAFLKRQRPYALLLAESELWPLTLALARKAGLRLALVNGRVTLRAFPRYRLLRGWVRLWLESFELIAAQSQGDARRFAALGAPSAVLRCPGNLKYDLARRPPEALLKEARRRLAALAWEGPIWTAASTRPGEEEAVLAAYAKLRADFRNLRLVLAPRHPERSEELASLLRRLGVPFVFWSDLDLPKKTPSPSPDCLLVDRLGSLGALYAASSAAFVGGSLAPIGGHNILEPALLSVPVLFGPHTWTVEEPARALEESQGGFRVRDAAELESRLRGLLEHPAWRQDAGRKAQEAAGSFQGAVERTLSLLEPFLRPPAK